MNLPLSQKSIAVVAVSLAVVVASIAAVVVSVNRADEAKAYAAAEIAEDDRAVATNKAAQAEAIAARARKAEAEAMAKAKADELAAQRLANRKEELARKTAADNLAAAEARAREAQANAELAKTFRDAVRVTNETARIERERARDLAAEAERKARIAEANRDAERARTEREAAEAKLLDLRKLNFEAVERELLAWKLALDERERALRPEKTIADLEWAGGMEDTVFDAKGNLTKQVKTEYDPEKDMELPEQSRRLAKTERKVREAQRADGLDTRSAVLKSMERLYVDALRENRVIDADFYKKSILVMYPDWKFKGEQKVEK